MKRFKTAQLGLALLVLLFLSPALTAQETGGLGKDPRLQPPLQQHDISAQMQALEKQLADANREAEFWRNARFYNDRKRERERKEKLVYWSQRTVQIRNQMTRLKQNRTYYQHKNYGDQKYYYVPQ